MRSSVNPTRGLSSAGDFLTSCLERLTFGRGQAAYPIPGDLIENGIHLTGHELSVREFFCWGRN